MSKKLKGKWPLGKSLGVCIHDNVLPPKLCRAIIKFFEDHPHLQYEGRTFGGVQPETKLTTDAFITAHHESIQNEEEREILRKFDEAIYEPYKVVLADYIAQYETLTREWVDREDTGYQYQRYAQGKGFYKSHIDGAPYAGIGGNTRVLGSVMYLNTVKKGGGTRFDNFDYTCDAVQGRILTFPTTFLHVHGGLVPRSSDKSIISTFVCSPPSPIDTTGYDFSNPMEVVDTGAELPPSEFD